MAGGGSSLEKTPAFAAATICFILVFVSIIIEHIIHLIGKWLKNSNRIKLYEALEKIKSELMLVGFISLLLTASQTSIAKICISRDVANRWLPCKSDQTDPNGESYSVCKKGKVQFISQSALHELHVFIFVLACAHVVNCVLTMVLAKAKMKKWNKWEGETKTQEYQSTHNSTPRYTRQTTFVRGHFNFWTTNPFLFPLRCFFRQFFSSVRKVDYLTLRHGFIEAHVAPEEQGNYDFGRYMDRSLGEDFKLVVGISPLVWLSAVLSLLFTKYEFRHAYWLPCVPVLVLLAVGTKLQVIIAKMAFRIQKSNDLVRGDPIVQVGDDLFWFCSPRFLLYLINFVVFQNAFQVGFFLYTWGKFGINSCFHKTKEEIIVSLCMGVLVLILCSYVTLPLYALVTLMGSTMKRTESSHRHKNNHRASSAVRPEPELLEAIEEAMHSTTSKSNQGQALHDDNNGSHTIGTVELSIQIPETQVVGSNDLSYSRRSKSCN